MLCYQYTSLYLSSTKFGLENYVSNNSNATLNLIKKEMLWHSD